MNNNTELTRMEEALCSDEALRIKLEEACRKIAESGEAKSDGEVMVKAAAEMGFSITIEDLERTKAASEELSDDELDKVAGGVSWAGEDNYGHDDWCFTAWHCMCVTLHTETDSDGSNHDFLTDLPEACFYNYVCLIGLTPKE